MYSGLRLILIGRRLNQGLLRNVQSIIISKYLSTDIMILVSTVDWEYKPDRERYIFRKFFTFSWSIQHRTSYISHISSLLSSPLKYNSHLYNHNIYNLVVSNHAWCCHSILDIKLKWNVVVPSQTFVVHTFACDNPFVHRLTRSPRNLHCSGGY